MPEQDKKYIGVVFRTHDEAGTALINIINTTTAATVLTNKSVDLYDKQYDISAAPTVYGLYCFWWEVTPATDNYSITVTLSPSTTIGRYLQIERYLDNSPITAGGVTTVMTTWDIANPLDTYAYTLVPGATTTLSKIEYFNGDGITKVFPLTTTNHAHEFMSFSVDGGSTWVYTTDILITWGSNTPNYDDSIIDANGHFTVKFVDAPISGVNNIGIQFLPIVTNYNLTRTMNQPSTVGYVDYQKEVRLLYDSLELIP